MTFPRNALLFLTAIALVSFRPNDKESIADASSYLEDIKSELKKEWPRVPPTIVPLLSDI
jgi:hypothetical protein